MSPEEREEEGTLLTWPGQLAVPRDAPPWEAQPSPWLQPVSDPSWLSSGKLPAASLPGSSQGCDPMEALSEERRGKARGLLGGAPAQEGAEERLPDGAARNVHQEGTQPPPARVPELPSGLGRVSTLLCTSVFPQCTMKRGGVP